MMLNLDWWKNHIQNLDNQTWEDEPEKFELERNILFDWEEDRNELLKQLEEIQTIFARSVRELEEEIIDLKETIEFNRKGISRWE